MTAEVRRIEPSDDVTPLTDEDVQEAQLRELRAQRLALQLKREEREAAAAAQRAIAEEQQALRDEVALGDAIDKHGEVGVHIATVQTARGLVILKRATAMKFRRFQDKTGATTEDVGALVRPCVVWPSQGELDVILDELPATLLRMASAVIALAGQRGEELGKK